jgi:predicted AAA+ superfamily ATPase
MQERLYSKLTRAHFAENQQMAFLCGPRQVGKTTAAEQAVQNSSENKYLNWDSLNDREIIESGYDAITDGLSLGAVTEKPTIIFDEIHKNKQWKNFLKGFFDTFKNKLHILVTGSAKLNMFRRSGDSLLGRYFLYRVHPLSVAELLRTDIPESPLSAPSEISNELFHQLVKFGGFPEPFLRADEKFSLKWQSLKQEQMIKEDIMAVEQINQLSAFEMLAFLLAKQAGNQVNYSNLANKVHVAHETIRRWFRTLEEFYYCFRIKPWSRNVTRSYMKEPKVYLWDWSQVSEPGMRVENFVAGHLLKAVHFWTDMGFGKFDLFYLRDKDKREVDFLITKNEKPWIMLEVKSSSKEPLSKNLLHFQAQIKAEHVLQLVFDAPYVDEDCFSDSDAKIVSMKTFLSQLV